MAPTVIAYLSCMQSCLETKGKQACEQAVHEQHHAMDTCCTTPKSVFSGTLLQPLHQGQLANIILILQGSHRERMFGP